MRLSKRRNEAGKRFRESIEEVTYRDTDCCCLIAQPLFDKGTIENKKAL